MNKTCTVGIGNTIPKNAESFSSTVLARDPADTIKLLVEMAISNKWVCPALHATGRMQGDDGSMLDILPVVVMVDAFPRTNDISGVMWQLAASFLPEFCNNPNWITRLFGMDGSEVSPECRKYFSELLSPFLVDCLKNPQNQVYEVVPGYNAARGWPPSNDVQKSDFEVYNFCIQPFVTMDGCAVSKVFHHSGATSERPSATVKELSLQDMRTPDIRLYNRNQFEERKDFFKEIENHAVEVVAKGIAADELNEKAPVRFFYTAGEISEIENGLVNFLKVELQREEYEGQSFYDIIDCKDEDRKKIAQKLRKRIRDLHSYRVGHGFYGPAIGGLLPWLRACKLHVEQNFIKLLLGNTIIFAIRWDSEEGQLENNELANSRTNLVLKVLFRSFQTRRVAKRVLQAVGEKGRDTTMSQFTWRLKSQDPVVYLNTFHDVWDLAFEVAPGQDEDFLFTRHILYVAHQSSDGHRRMLVT